MFTCLFLFIKSRLTSKIKVIMDKKKKKKKVAKKSDYNFSLIFSSIHQKYRII